MGAGWKRKETKPTGRMEMKKKKNEKYVLLGPNAVTTTKSRIEKEE